MTTKFPKLSLGDFGNIVGIIQMILGLFPTNIFDEATETIIFEYQEKHKLQQTGIVDNKTWICLINDMKKMKFRKI